MRPSKLLQQFRKPSTARWPAAALLGAALPACSAPNVVADADVVATDIAPVMDARPELDASAADTTVTDARDANDVSDASDAMDVTDASDVANDANDVMDARDANDANACGDAAACGASCVDLATDTSHCGACGRACVAPENGAATCVAGACGLRCDPGFVAMGSRCVAIAVAAPRPMRPLSSQTVSSRTPTLRWALAPSTDGARVELCRDRACTLRIATLDAVGTSATPTSPLPTGVVYWRLFGRSGANTGTSPSPTWQLHVGPRSAPRDTAWGSVFDLNGDGFADVGIGGSGFVEVFHGSSSGLAAAPSVVLNSPDAGPSAFGRALASAGDVNGDGFADLIVGAKDTNALRGRAFVYFGRSAGVSTSPSQVIEAPPASDGRFGTAVSTAGDVNADGYADVIVGAEGENTLTGRAYVFLGGPSGLVATPQRALSVIDSDPPSALDRFSYFGATVAGGGDVNGDGYADVVVGAYGYRENRGIAQLYAGGPTGVAARYAWSSIGTEVDGEFARSVAIAGDVNGDGFADIVVGAPSEALDQGRVYVFHGSVSGAAGFTTRITGSGSVGTGLGKGLSMSGDLNGDGFTDLLVGAYLSNTIAGRAASFHGGASAVSATPVAMFTPTGLAGRFGWGVGIPGDTNGDGFAEAVVSEYSRSRVHVYVGSATGSVTPAARMFAHATSDYGYAVAH